MENHPRRQPIQQWDIYPITSLELANGRSYPEIAEAMLEGGARVIQLRDKQTDFHDLVKAGRDMARIVRDSGAQLIVNDNPYLAKEIGADGVHLGQTDCPVDIARDILGPNKLIGLSTHTIHQALRAQMLPNVDYIGWGPIFATETKPGANEPLGLDGVAWAARNLKIAFVCIGGINAENIESLAQRGAKICAAVSAVMQNEDITASTRKLRQMLTGDQE
ncbi:thiamine phosphate synthase [Candidatus Sumerlaeota bacterium]|nr:thiamine phosphate synthase [Candidatus Sumerlaeota bacterium]